MLDQLKLAWRNLSRNRRRSLTTGVALAFGIALCVASYGLVDGLNAQMLHALTRLDLGHLQVHQRAYVERRNLQETIADPAEVLEAAAALPEVAAAAPRVYAFALVSGEGKSAGVELVGIDPSREPLVTELDQQIQEGRTIDAEPTPWPAARELSAEERERDAALTEEAEERIFDEIDALPTISSPTDPAGDDSADPAGDDAQPAAVAATGEPRGGASSDLDAETANELRRAVAPPPERPLRVILGQSLARVLGVGVGGKLFSTTLTSDGLSESAFFEVVGIYQTGTQTYDRGRIYLHIADAQRLTHLGSAVHEVSVLLHEAGRSSEVATALGAALHRPDLLVRPWNQIRPDIQQMLVLNEVSTDLMVFIIFVVATLGVVNTMLMSVFERTRELGVLKAIGMSAWRILGLIVTETVLLVLVASAVGTLIGLGLDAYMIHHGVDLSDLTAGISFSGIGVSPVIHGVITARGVLMPTVVLSICCILASLYPAARAARLQPAVGMRET